MLKIMQIGAGILKKWAFEVAVVEVDFVVDN